jgi:DNA-binding beta-propeller fold protein YncE
MKEDRTMNKLVAAASVGLWLAGLAHAADATPAQGPIVIHDKITLKGAITAIDRANRTVTLKGPQGNLLTLDVDESVTRFDALKVGDIVTGQYYESVAYDIQKPGTAKTPDSVTRDAGKFNGAKPGGAAMETRVTTVTILAIDPKAPAVVFRTSDGETKTYRVRHPEYLDRVKVGDQVLVKQTAALLIEVTPAK